ncbi:hypothetical protein [Steroidobacter cummioxidans]|uniref:hypothetical protein n=1 Tax=Steroidobacter cummioxidans TaxID=1803913 RepID=UPI000E30E031|nr:hypothetical protein [Steroidobacter cummioxidans]
MYDVFSRRTSISRGNGTTTGFGYDAASRPLSLSQDLASTGRDLNLSFGYNSAGQVTERGLSNDAYAYFSTTQSTSYARDGRNRYTTVSGVAHVYDQRSGGVTTRYLYDGDQLVAEYHGATPVRRYVRGAGVDKPLVWYEGAGLTDRRWLHADHQGSVVATSDGAGAGTVYAYSDPTGVRGIAKLYG